MQNFNRKKSILLMKNLQNYDLGGHGLQVDRVAYG
jgi:hypothetical protein